MTTLRWQLEVLLDRLEKEKRIGKFKEIYREILTTYDLEKITENQYRNGLAIWDFETAPRIIGLSKLRLNNFQTERQKFIESVKSIIKHRIKIPKDEEKKIEQFQGFLSEAFLSEDKESIDPQGKERLIRLKKLLDPIVHEVHICRFVKIVKAIPDVDRNYLNSPLLDELFKLVSSEHEYILLTTFIVEAVKRDLPLAYAFLLDMRERHNIRLKSSIKSPELYNRLIDYETKDIEKGLAELSKA